MTEHHRIDDLTDHDIVMLARDHIEQARAWHLTIVLIATGFVVQAGIVAVIIINDHFKVNMLWDMHHVQLVTKRTAGIMGVAEACEVNSKGGPK